ncbi:ubiquitin carboxyl-terminal hydrolase 12 [Artemisia annua]|uniref:ubiquitinyl hydrolase 1 n=1 Tax=Artemisia annua TaxID=35608 RepID=A0A2U1MAQ6_ARTAN|nr:ubiquitin carboxyl-terminal hydrolase 12 [Artemisia annua]
MVIVQGAKSLTVALSDTTKAETSDILYHEVVDIPLPEMRHLKTLEVAFHHATTNEVVIYTIRLPKQSTVGDVINYLKTKVELSHEDAELRLLETCNSIIYQVFVFSVLNYKYIKIVSITNMGGENV